MQKEEKKNETLKQIIAWVAKMQTSAEVVTHRDRMLKKLFGWGFVLALFSVNAVLLLKQQ